MCETRCRSSWIRFTCMGMRNKWKRSNNQLNELIGPCGRFFRAGYWTDTTIQPAQIKAVQRPEAFVIMRRAQVVDGRGNRYTECVPFPRGSMNRMSRPLYEADPDVAAAIDNETRRQHEGLELIASENFVSEAVLEAMGSVFTNKYAEGYPGKIGRASC